MLFCLLSYLLAISFYFTQPKFIKMRTYRNLLFMGLLIMLQCPLKAQVSKFGKINRADLEMETYAPDPEAEAVVLFDKGESFFNILNTGEIEMIHKRHTRIKIFKNTGYDYADIEIPFYVSNSSAREHVRKIKGATYELKDGAIVKYDLKKDDIFTEEDSENWRTTKFTMPQVGEGVIIEYTYTIHSDFYSNLRDWYFQNTIPIKFSQYRVSIPEFYFYKTISQGFVLPQLETKTSALSFGSRTFTNNERIWSVEEIPAFRPERYISSIQDHISKIEFQLASIQFPNTPVQNFSDSWDKLSERLENSEYFGGQLKKKNQVKEIVAAINLKAKTPREKMDLALAFVHNEISWNKYYGIYTNKGIRKTLDEKKGNVGDINLLLTLILRELGLEANPILLSTRGNGLVNPLYPSLSKFDYVVVGVLLDGKQVFLDGVDDFCPSGMIASRCLNRNGLMVVNKTTNWVPLSPDFFSVQKTYLNLEMDAEGIVTGNLSNNLDKYKSMRLRKSLINGSSEEYFKNKIEAERVLFEVNDTKVENLKAMDKPLLMNSAISYEPEETGDLLYLDAFLEKNYTENPFKLEERQYPVDFSYPFQNSYTLVLKLPENIQVEDLPKNITVSLPDKTGKFTFITSHNATMNSIQVRSNFILGKTMFSTQEYEGLKEFYNLMIEKTQAKIVLKKVNN